MLRLVGVTACPTGITHNYMAVEKLEEAAKNKGFQIKVETRGFVGIENRLTREEIQKADVVVLGVGVSVDKSMFLGKKIVEVSVSDAIHNSDKVMEKAKAAAEDAAYPVYAGGKEIQAEERTEDTFINRLRKFQSI